MEAFTISSCSRSLNRCTVGSSFVRSVKNNKLYSLNEDGSETDAVDEELSETSDSVVEVSSDETIVMEEDTEFDVDVEELSTTSRSSSEVVCEILKIGAASDRGQTATLAEHNAVSGLIGELESMEEEDKFEGDSTGTWELVYSSTQLFRSSPFFMAGRAVCKTQEEAQQYDWFCDMHRAALAISTIGKVRQVVSSNRIVSEFEVKAGAVPFLNDFTPFSYSGGLPFAIEGAIVSSADIAKSDQISGVLEWELYMDTVEIKGSNIPLLRRLLDNGLKLASRNLGDFLEETIESYSNPRPVFRTTYMKEGIRISRDQDGKMFVYVKVSDSVEPKDYSSSSPDLGLTKLLEGINDTFTKVYI